MITIQDGAHGDWQFVTRSRHKRACPHVRRWILINREEITNGCMQLVIGV